MNLDGFKSQISRSGLARNSNWVCSIFPPRSMSSMSLAETSNIPIGDFGSLQIPTLDLGTIPIAEINGANGNTAQLSMNANALLPNLGFTSVNTGTALERLNLYCVQSTIPNREIENLTFREYGQERKLGFRHKHTDVTMSYYCSENMAERFFFEQWTDIMFNHKTKKIGYYEDYTSTVEIAKYSAGWKKQEALYKLVEAYPTNIASQTLTYEGTALLRLDMTFKYRYYERLK